MASPLTTFHPTSKPRRNYTIESRFGQARQRRSKKNRPCDTCRRRKTACVIPDAPPCVYCRVRNLPCRSSLGQDSLSPVRDVADDLPAFDSTFDASGSVSLSPELSIASQDLPMQGREVESPALYAIDGDEHRTAHAIGLTGEQDTYLLDSFRAFIMSEEDEIDASIIQVYKGSSFADPPVHFCVVENEFPQHTNLAMNMASEAIENLISPYGPALVRLYFTHVHPTYPILSKSQFLSKYAESKDKIPASLRGAVYALASSFWFKDPSMTFPCPFAQHEVVDHAHNSLRRELEAPNLSKLQACLLLLNMRPPEIDSVETPSTWILATQATACAQLIGLHQDCTKWAISPAEKKLRTKLWWATFIVDAWSATCHGTPPHIQFESYQIPMLEMADMRCDEDVPPHLRYLVESEAASFQIATGARFIEMIKLSVHLRRVLDCSRNGDMLIRSIDRLTATKTELTSWSLLLPQCLSLEKPQNGALHLTYHATQALLFRALMYPATREAKAVPTSRMRQWFPTALHEFSFFSKFMASLSSDSLETFWLRHTRSQFIILCNSLIYLFLLASSPEHVEQSFRLLEEFQGAIQRLVASSNIDARLHLRPAILRIDAFFTKAADWIKDRGSQDGGNSMDFK